MIDTSELLRIISDEMSNSEQEERVAIKQNAEAYYAGALPSKPTTPRRSGVVSTDVADAVEWILPSLVESLSGKVVKFTPMSAPDEDQADLESEFSYYCFSEENPGFVNLYSFCKDALMTGNGIWKVYYDNAPERITENYDGLQDAQLQALLSDPMVEVVEIERGDMGTRVTIARIIKQGKVVVQTIPLQEFRVNNDHDSIDLKDARFTAHSYETTASDLLRAGYDPEIIENASEDYLDNDYQSYDQDSTDPSQKRLVVSDCYAQIDINEDGISELCRVVVLGQDQATALLDVQEVDAIPFFSSSCIPRTQEQSRNRGAGQPG